jgi:hypothetical protein
MGSDIFLFLSRPIRFHYPHDTHKNENKKGDPAETESPEKNEFPLSVLQGNSIFIKNKSLGSRDQN